MINNVIGGMSKTFVSNIIVVYIVFRRSSINRGWHNALQVQKNIKTIKNFASENYLFGDLVFDKASNDQQKIQKRYHFPKN